LGNVSSNVNSLITSNAIIYPNIVVLSQALSNIQSNITTLNTINSLLSNIAANITSLNTSNTSVYNKYLTVNSNYNTLRSKVYLNLPGLTINNNQWTLSNGYTLTLNSGSTVYNGVVTLQTYTGNNNQNLYINSNGFVTTQSSDERLKSNIQPISSGLKFIEALNPVTFTWKNKGINDIGFIAQEIQQIDPKLVYNNSVFLGFDQSKLIAYLVKSIQELNEEINILMQE